MLEKESSGGAGVTFATSKLIYWPARAVSIATKEISNRYFMCSVITKYQSTLVIVISTNTASQLRPPSRDISVLYVK